jgi:hypothetical protein
MGSTLEIIAGVGKTLNISSSGILFTSGRNLPQGTHLEVSISWPAQLSDMTNQLSDKYVINLVARGHVIRQNDGKVALQIKRYEFRTESRKAR